MKRTTATGSSGGLFVAGTLFDAEDGNMRQEEKVNLVLSSGQALDALDDEQMARATAILAGSACAGVDTGVADAYEVAPLRSAVVAPTSYVGMDGFMVYFDVSGVNTGASTLDFNGFGAKSFTDRSGSALAANDVISTTFAVFNETLDRWEFLFDAGTVSGVVDLTGQSSVINIDTTVSGTPTNPLVEVVDGGIDTLQLGSEAVEADKLDSNVTDYLPSAWGNSNGTLTVPGTRGNHNIASVIAIAGGARVTFDTAMANANYAVVVGGATNADGAEVNQDFCNVYDLTTTDFKVKTWSNEDSTQDWENLFFMVLGGN